MFSMLKAPEGLQIAQNAGKVVSRPKISSP
jgi:hypothetical protein